MVWCGVWWCVGEDEESACDDFLSADSEDEQSDSESEDEESECVLMMNKK